MTSGTRRTHPMAAAGEKPEVVTKVALAPIASAREAASAREKAYLRARPFSCTLCEKRFISLSHRREHQRVHTGERPFPCPDCDRSFTTTFNLKRHRAIHEKEENYRCLRCGVLFCHLHNDAGDAIARAPVKPKGRRQQLRAAPVPRTSSKPAVVKTPRPRKPALVKAPLPAIKMEDEQDPSPPGWVTHVQPKGAEPVVVTLRQNTATGIQWIPMAEVGERAAETTVSKATPDTTAWGANRAFLKGRPFGCPLCDKRFQSSSHLREHKRVHTGERPFLCGHCDRSFTTQHNLKRHQTIHVKEESYRCRRCGVLFCHVHKDAGDAVAEALSKPKPRRQQHPKAPGSPPGPLASPKPTVVKTRLLAIKKEADQDPSSLGLAMLVQRKGAESEVVTLRRNAGGMQNKIAYDIEVVL